MKGNLRQLQKLQEKKRDFCRGTRAYEWDAENPFTINPDRWIGGAAARCAAKRQEKMKLLHRRMRLRMDIAYGGEPEPVALIHRRWSK